MAAAAELLVGNPSIGEIAGALEADTNRVGERCNGLLRFSAGVVDSVDVRRNVPALFRVNTSCFGGLVLERTLMTVGFGVQIATRSEPNERRLKNLGAQDRELFSRVVEGFSEVVDVLDMVAAGELSAADAIELLGSSPARV